ncbi:MAG: M14 family zinc carboxypeptidase [Planctomycetota bacterium]
MSILCPALSRWLTVCLLVLTASASASANVDADAFDYLDGLDYGNEITTPAAFLGYEIGDHFTRHHNVIAYCKLLAEESDRVTYAPYGLTHQRRELGLLTISSPANLNDIEDILERNRALTDPATDDATVTDIIDNNPAIVWLSYNVHGNEPSPSEAALMTAYSLAAAEADDMNDWLGQVVIVIDPMLNPDGRERYVSWFQNARGVQPNADPIASEHHEPWPGGRVNHYMFDLNRDWVWLVHPESRQRMVAYRRYLPHLHIDYHEQGFRSPYFLGAGDDPYNANIPDETRTWIERYGAANATAFDARGWVYSTRERFDYLYPGYGKVLPVYHGAVGMLAEQAGHSRAGTAIRVSDTYTLTLRERTLHHWLLGMSNIETTVRNRREQLVRFRAFFVDSCNADSYTTRACVIHPANDRALLKRVYDLCSAHGIRIETLRDDTTLGGLHRYRDGAAAEPVELPAGTWIIRMDQPMGRLASVLFEREPVVTDADTYDITAWPVPIDLGLDAWYSTMRIDAPSDSLDMMAQWVSQRTGTKGTAVLIDADQHEFPRAVGFAVQHELFARFAGDDLTVDGRSFGRGSMIIHRIRNDEAVLNAFLSDVQQAGLDVHDTSRGITESGPVLGANANRRLVLPKVMLLRGDPFSALSFGQLWHLFDIASPMPYTAVNIDDISNVKLSDFNLIVMPDARALDNAFDTNDRDKLDAWIRAGGTILAVGYSAEWVNSRLLDVKPETIKDDRPALSTLSFGDRRARFVLDRVPGTTLRATVDTTHPLSAGLPDWMGVIKRGTRRLGVADRGSVIARFDTAPRIAGVMSERNESTLSETPFVTHHRHGSGSVISFVEDVTLRGFQHAPMRFLLNAVSYGPSL